jgi:hypothetical protein
MGGLREWSPPKYVNLDGGLEWNCSQLRFQLERAQNRSRDPQKRKVVFNKLRDRMVF